MKRVLVGTDGSPTARHAVDWAVALCHATGAELLLASSVAVPTGMELRPGKTHELCDSIGELLEGPWSEPARAVGVDVSTWLLEGDPRQQLVRAAANEDVDLIVIGTIGAGGGFWGLGMGGSTHYLIHHAGRPIAMVPAKSGPLRGGRIIVGVDGSEACAPALAWALSTAADVDARGVLAVHAYNPLADSYPHPPVDNWHYRGEVRVREQVELAGTGAEVPLELRLHGAHPVTALTEAADETDASMIVTGTRGRGGFHGLVIGKVPLRLLHHATRPVAVVPHR